jgi:hypothetical protein
MLSAVAAGGTLLAVFHALRDHRHATDHGFDPDDYVQIEYIVERLDDSWEIQVLQSQPRNTVEATTPHTHDTVLRARRLR